MNIFGKSQVKDTISPTTNLHSYRFIGEEMEALGLRLDAARAALSTAGTTWAKWYWQETLDRLLIQWRALPILHDGEAQSTLIPKWTVDYNYYERNTEIGALDFDDKIWHKIHQPNLDESWDRVRTERIMRCNCQ
jgi:hypothetical protein